MGRAVAHFSFSSSMASLRIPRARLRTALIVVFKDSTTPSVIPSTGDISSELTAISPGVTDTTLGNNGWTCIDPNPSLTVCAPPGLGFPPRPPLPNNGGAPSYTLMIFTRDHQLDHHAKFLRPDLYQGQPCLGDEPWTLSARYNYNECIIPVRGTGR